MAPPDQPAPGGNAAGNVGNAGNAGNAQGAQGAGNAAAAARPETKSNKKLPEFHAEESTLSASLWLVDCEHTKGYNNWSDQQTLDAMILALKGKALSWRETLTLD